MLPQSFNFTIKLYYYHNKKKKVFRLTQIVFTLHKFTFKQEKKRVSKLLIFSIYLLLH